MTVTGFKDMPQVTARNWDNQTGTFGDLAAGWNLTKAEAAMRRMYSGGEVSVEDALLVLEMQYHRTRNTALQARLAEQYLDVQRPDAHIVARLTRRYVEFDIVVDPDRSRIWRDELIVEAQRVASKRFGGKRKLARIEAMIAVLTEELGDNGPAAYEPHAVDDVMPVSAGGYSVGDVADGHQLIWDGTSHRWIPLS